MPMFSNGKAWVPCCCDYPKMAEIGDSGEIEQVPTNVASKKSDRILGMPQAPQTKNEKVGNETKN